MTTLDFTDPSQFGFPAGSLIYDCKPSARKAIIEARLRIRGVEVFSRFWERVLTANERKRLGNDMEPCFAAEAFSANCLGRLRGWSAEHAIIEIAYRVGFLSIADYEWLLASLGVAIKQSILSRFPSWDLESGCLWLDGRIVRTVRVRVATNLVRVLNVFQEAGWPRCIVNPITSVDSQKIHEVVQSLNNNLIGIRFRVQDDNICWDWVVNSTS